MYSKSKLLKNTILISLAQISAQIINFLFLPLYTAVLTPEEYGLVDLYSTARAVFSYLVFLGMENAIFMFCVSEKDMQRKKEYFSSGLILVGILGFIFTIIFQISNAIIKFQYGSLVYFFLFSYFLYYLLLYLARGLEKLKVYAIATAMATVLSVLCNLILVIYFELGVRGVFISGIVSYSLIDICILLRLSIWKMFLPRIDFVKTKELLQYAIPIVLNNVAGWIASSSDKIVISVMLGVSANGIYSLANKFYSAINILTHGFIMAWSEAAVKVADQLERQKYYYKIINMSMDVIFIVVLAVVTFLPFIFFRVFHPEYYSAYYHIPIIIYAALWWIMAAVVGWINVAHKKTKEFGLSTFYVGIVNLVIHLALIHYIGLYAASISTLISYFVLFVLRYINMHKIEKIPCPVKKIIVQLGIYLVACFCYCLNTMQSRGVVVAVFAINIVIIVIKYKEAINVILRNWNSLYKHRKGLF